jgi:nucleoside 2-deoxyribosyltransferase
VATPSGEQETVTSVVLRNLTNPSPPGSTALQLGAVAAVYVLWLISWLVLGPGVFGAAHYNWAQTLVAAAAALLAFVASWRAARPYPAFLVMIGLGLTLLAISWVTYSPDASQPFLRFAADGAPSYSDLSYALFVFVWVCAWGYLALRKWQRRPPSALTGVVFAVLIGGLAVILVSFYYPEYRSSMNTMSGRLDAVTAGLEFAALVIGLACILIGQPAVLTWMLIATALLVASDMAYSGSDVPAAIAPVWMLGQFLLASALLVFPRAKEPSLLLQAPVRARSALSGVLILLSLGGMLLSVAIGMVSVHPVWKSFLAVLFVVVFVVAVVWLTDRFDEAVQYLETYTAKLHQQQLRAEDWREADTSIRTTLVSTGLGGYLDALRLSGERLRDDVLFLGSERLYPPPHVRANRVDVRCFIVMPFSLEWSNDVHKALAAACKAMSVTPVRGDDVFTPTDILVDIWQSINAADFVVADITGRNPNVLYELGVAHTLAKPVLIISRHAADIPIDLSTRRIILYGQSEDHWREDLGTKVTKAIAEILRMYGLSATAPELAEPASQSAVLPSG